MAQLTIEIDVATRGRLEEIARASGREIASLADTVLSAYAEANIEYWRAMQRGLDDAEAGRVVDHATVVAETRAWFARQEAA